MRRKAEEKAGTFLRKGHNMIDCFNRKIDYIRISVTDRCNLRCIYCMPKEGVRAVNHKDILTYEEIIRLCRCFASLGISKIKITGGEPLVRKDVAELIGWIKCLEGIKNVTLTTNGVQLKKQLSNLVKNGLDGINVSLDTLDPDIYEAITGEDALQQVLTGVHEALQYPELKVKLNCVPMQNTRKTDIVGIAGLAKNHRLNVRFIEMIPIGLGRNFTYYSEDDIIQILEEAYGPLEVYDKTLGNGPAHYYSIPGFEGKIGFISAISHQFCGECNRVRLTSEGFLKTCLQYENGIDLKALLRGKADDWELEQAIRHAIFHKPVGHNFRETSHFEAQEQSHMSRIGG